jgi:hypothetical protein
MMEVIKEINPGTWILPKKTCYRRMQKKHKPEDSCFRNLKDCLAEEDSKEKNSTIFHLLLIFCFSNFHNTLFCFVLFCFTVLAPFLVHARQVVYYSILISAPFNTFNKDIKSNVRLQY